MKKMILALVAVLAMSGMSFAEFTIDATQTGTIGDTLEVWLVTAGGAKTFKDVKIDIPVHQVNMFGGYPSKAVSTCFLESMPPTEGYEGADTHFMFSESALSLQTPGSNFTNNETNDKSNPAGLVDTEGAGFKFGLGGFDGTADGFALGAPLAAGSPFMQVVIPKGAIGFLTGLAVADGVEVPILQQVGVPEPSTVLLLVAGFACLLVARFRK